MGSDAEADLLARCRRGEAAAWDELFDRHYGAAGRFIFQLGHDFTREDVEEICQEVFLSVIKRLDSFQGESQFQTWLFRIAANKARDFRERGHAAKRGGGWRKIELTEALDVAHAREVDMIALDLALESLSARDPQQCRIVELRYFGGLTIEDTAKFLKISPATVKRDWNLARAWLYREISGSR